MCISLDNTQSTLRVLGGNLPELLGILIPYQIHNYREDFKLPTITRNVKEATFEVATLPTTKPYITESRG